ncbi:hypothetical protein [Cupriavidus campinensis]|uniref:Uncharacterized protein n=1 Tax=Cupriavidus campinensis TaxID=151783 RepID=A0ABY3ESV5_9BURK|nr:hypothetical protein [Cupriavidus campinensis]TSP14054.1 hypothetical protein FGG12_06180 [Cupriavidus campinensis]
MALPSSGTITAAMINTELKRSANAPFSINDAAVRKLAGKASGPISFADFYGKSASTEVNMSTVMWIADPWNGASDPESSQAVASPTVPDHGGQLQQVSMTTSYYGPDDQWKSGWTYSLGYTSAPSYAGPLRVTNVNTGVSLVLSKVGPSAWRYVVTNSSANTPVDPNKNWIRQGAHDLFRIEEA